MNEQWGEVSTDDDVYIKEVKPEVERNKKFRLSSHIGPGP